MVQEIHNEKLKAAWRIFKQNKYEEAISKFNKVRETEELDPSDKIFVDSGLAESLWRVGQWDGAIKAFRTVLPLVDKLPQDVVAVVHFMIGDAQLRTDQYDSAAKSFVNALTQNTLGPEDTALAYSRLGKALWAQDLFRQSINPLEIALDSDKLSPQNACDARIALADSLVEVGAYHQAVAECIKALASPGLPPNAAPFVLNRLREAQSCLNPTDRHEVTELQTGPLSPEDVEQARPQTAEIPCTRTPLSNTRTVVPASQTTSQTEPFFRWATTRVKQIFSPDPPGKPTSRTPLLCRDPHVR